MTVDIHPGIAESDLPEVAAALSDAFAEYPVPMAFTPDGLRAMVTHDDVVLGVSQLARDVDGRILGVGLAALRGDQGRVAAMGVARGSHRAGVGRTVGEALLIALSRAGAREAVLEALTVNTAALALYEGPLGFTRRRRLIGLERPPGGSPITATQWDDALRRDTEPGSWQLARVVSRAREHEDLVSVPAVVPDNHPVAELLRGAGFREAAIAQYELRRPLTPPV